MPPPPVAMAASKLRIQTLQEQLKQKDRIIYALEAQKRSRLAFEAEKARQKELAKMNMGWRRHNANPHTPWIYRSGEIKGGTEGNVKTEKAIFVTEYRFAIESVKKVNAEAELAEARVQTLRAEQRDAYRKAQELIKVAEELEVKVARETRVRVAQSSPKEDQDATTSDGDTTNSDGDVKMGEFPTATAPKNGRLVLNPPKRERSLSTENIRPTRLRLSQPKRERSVSVEEIHPTRFRLSQPKRKVGDESSEPVEAFRSTRAEKVRDESHRVRNGRVLKARRRQGSKESGPPYWHVY